MAALGTWGDLTDATNIQIIEATTAAAAWARSEFIGAGALIRINDSDERNRSGEHSLAVALR